MTKKNFNTVSESRWIALHWVRVCGGISIDVIAGEEEEGPSHTVQIVNLIWNWLSKNPLGRPWHHQLDLWICISIDVIAGEDLGEGGRIKSHCSNCKFNLKLITKESSWTPMQKWRQVWKSGVARKECGCIICPPGWDRVKLYAKINLN